jgi:hypothetical protein
VARADSETVFSVVKQAEDSLKAGLESAWKISALHNRNHMSALLVGNIHRLATAILAPEDREGAATHGSLS